MRSALRLCLLMTAAGVVQASVITGTYSLGPGGDGNQATGSGPFSLTATNSTFSYVDFIPNEFLTFGQLTSLFAVFVSNIGGSGGGTPRFSVGLDDSGTEKNLHILLGFSPAFNDSDVVLNFFNGFNVIGNNDPGRYDTSNFSGGSPFTDYSTTLALVGSLQVQDIFFVTDTFDPFPSRDETLFALGGTFTPAEVPEPGSLGLIGVGLLLLATIRRRT